MESKTLIRVKAHVNSKLKETVLSYCPHYLVGSHNKNQSSLNLNLEFDTKSMSQMFQEFPYHSDFPKPLLPPGKIQRDYFGRDDITMQLIHTKAKIQDDLNRYLELYKKYSSTLEKYKNKSIEWKKNNNDYITLPKYVASTSEILDCDPDPNFIGTYNWYYSGGTLNSILNNSRTILIFPFMDELILLPIRLKEDSLLIPDYKNATKVPFKENIFEIISSTSKNMTRILTRQKNNCCLYNIFNFNKKKVQLLEIDKISSDSPYISADFDPLNINNYCIATVNRSIKIWDINKSKFILSGNIPVTSVLEDSWACIKYDEYNNNILKYTDRQSVHYYDTRLPIERSILVMCPKNNLENCESLCSYIASTKSNYFSYIGSNHSLSLLDNRSPNNAVVKKWTHQFKSSPLFNDVCFRDNKEFLIIASQLAGETAIILNCWNSSEESPESYSTPFSPPSNLETLTVLQSQGKCLNPHIRDRLLLCNTGCMTMIDQQSAEVFLLTQNSLNDIFYQGIGHQETLDFYSLENCKALYKLKIWEKQILKNSHHNIISPIVVTKRTNAYDIFQNFTNQNLRCNNKNVDNKELEYLPNWKRSLAELNSFLDIFAPELLTHWEIVDEISLISTTAAPHQKVLSWLGITDQNKLTSEEIIDLQQTAEIEIQEISVNKDLALFIAKDNESPEQFFLPKVKSQIKSKSFTNRKDKDKKRSNFVPGF
jgi:hypothetical protein